MYKWCAVSPAKVVYYVHIVPSSAYTSNLKRSDAPERDLTEVPLTFCDRPCKIAFFVPLIC